MQSPGQVCFALLSGGNILPNHYNPQVSYTWADILVRYRAYQKQLKAASNYARMMRVL